MDAAGCDEIGAARGGAAFGPADARRNGPTGAAGFEGTGATERPNTGGVIALAEDKCCESGGAAEDDADGDGAAPVRLELLACDRIRAEWGCKETNKHRRLSFVFEGPRRDSDAASLRSADRDRIKKSDQAFLLACAAC